MITATVRSRTVGVAVRVSGRYGVAVDADVTTPATGVTRSKPDATSRTVIRWFVAVAAGVTVKVPAPVPAGAIAQKTKVADDDAAPGAACTSVHDHDPGQVVVIADAVSGAVAVAEVITDEATMTSRPAVGVTVPVVPDVPDVTVVAPMTVSGETGVPVAGAGKVADRATVRAWSPRWSSPARTNPRLRGPGRYRTRNSGTAMPTPFTR